MKKNITIKTLANLRKEFSSLRHQTNSLNDTERYNVVRVRMGLKPVRVK